MKTWTNTFLGTFLLALFLLPNTSRAQGWERIFDTSDSDVAITAVEGIDGNYVVVGSSNNALGQDTTLRIYMTKLDPAGNQLWTRAYGTSNQFGLINKVINTADGGFLLGGRQKNGVPAQAFLIKTDIDGNEEWSNFYDDGSGASSEIEDVIQNAAGDFIFTGYIDRQTDDAIIGKVAPNGNLIWMQSYHEILNDHGRAVVEAPNGDIIITGFTNGGNGQNDFLLLRVDDLGNKIWSTTSDIYDIARFIQLKDNGDIITIGQEDTVPGVLNRYDANGNFISSISIGAGQLTINGITAATADGGYITSGVGVNNSVISPFLIKSDSLGNVEWNQYYDNGVQGSFSRAIQTSDLGFLAVGEKSVVGNISAHVVKTDKYGRLYSNIINSRIVHDTSMDCIADSAEAGLNNWIVEAQKNTGQSFYSVSDSLGNYEITADTGSYLIILHPPSNYWNACADSIPLTITTFYDTVQVDFPMQPNILCPLLSVDLGTVGLRRCFDNTYSVQYCNDGTEVANNAYVDITLDPFLTFVSATIPEQMIATDIYRFQLGDVGIGACGNFNVVVNVDCDSTILGQTHCVEAHIYPDSLCAPVDANWSGAFVEVGAECQSDSLEFVIENTGSGSMDGPLNYVIIEDAILKFTQPFDLDPGGLESFRLPIDNGSTYVLYAQQEPGAPGNSIPILSVEGCVITTGAPFSTGFVNQFPQNDLNPFVDIDCRQNVGSYDPNDKQAFPEGYGPEHFIEVNTSLEYLIRFQNTGTDTAFTVVIRDTLSEYLNPATLRPGSSSHPYTFELSGDGIITFTFNNIELPDSNVNLLGSNGFVKFKIAQNPDNALTTVIENRAGIYFDFNPPVITNTVFHTIGENIIDVVIVDATKEPSLPKDIVINAYPNPFQESAQFDISGSTLNDGSFILYNVSGKKIRHAKFQGNQYTFYRQDLPAGLYFFQVTESGQLIGKGKLVIH